MLIIMEEILRDIQSALDNLVAQEGIFSKITDKKLSSNFNPAGPAKGNDSLVLKNLSENGPVVNKLANMYARSREDFTNYVDQDIIKYMKSVGDIPVPAPTIKAILDNIETLSKYMIDAKPYIERCCKDFTAKVITKTEVDNIVSDTNELWERRQIVKDAYAVFEKREKNCNATVLTVQDINKARKQILLAYNSITNTYNLLADTYAQRIHALNDKFIRADGEYEICDKFRYLVDVYATIIKQAEECLLFDNVGRMKQMMISCATNNHASNPRKAKIIVIFNGNGDVVRYEVVDR